MSNKRGQMGFTLIEIISVLVILGILAAVAVPKYYDLQTEAQKKAAMAAVTEYQARLNLVFGQTLLKGATTGSTTSTACENAVTDTLAAVSTTLDTGGWTITPKTALAKAGDSTIVTGAANTSAGITVTFDSGKEPTVYAPSCEVVTEKK